MTRVFQDTKCGLLALLVVLAVSTQPSPVWAEERKAAAVVYHNCTTSTIKIEAQYLIDRDGNRRHLSGQWRLAPGAKSYLLLAGKKLVAHKFVYKLQTADGSTTWSGTCHVLDEDGDFVLKLTEAHLREHRRDARGAKGVPGRKTGRVYLANRTTQPITITCRHYLDGDGKRQQVASGAWVLRPNVRGFLADGGKPFRASRFEFTLKTAEGSTAWHLETFDRDGDLTLVVDAAFLRRHLARLPARRPAGAHAGPDREAVKRAVGKVLLAAVTHAASKKEPRNLGEAIAKTLAIRLRDELIESAMIDLYPRVPRSEIQTARQVICLSLDGKLNLRNLSRQKAKEALLARLKAANRDMANAAVLADFIQDVIEARNRGR
jgi:hypothetical protein